MDTILGRFRNLIVLAVILFAQIVGLAVQVKRPAQQGDTRLIRVWVAGAITPFEKAVVTTQNFFYGIWHNYVYLRGVRRENRELRAELDRMKLEQVRLKEDADMARRIQSLLAFKEQHVDATVAAQVIGTSGSDQSRVLYIDKGSADGIRSDMAVITPNGIVGKIVQVFPDSAQVLPINDQMSGVGVALRNSRLQGILRGGADGTTTIQYIMADERVTPGEDVITSGGDRIFPKGLPVGKVVDVKPGKDLFLNIQVSPSSQLDHLEEVLVVTKVSEKPPDTQDLGPIRASDILAQRLPTIPEKPATDANVQPGATAGAANTGAGTTKPTTGATAGGSTAAGAASARTGTAANSPGKPAGAGSTAANTAGRTAGTNGTSTATTRQPGAASGVSGSASSSGTAARKPAGAAPTDTTAATPGSEVDSTSGTKPVKTVVDNDAPVASPRKPPSQPASDNASPSGDSPSRPASEPATPQR
jgi:rod shape-determining protein MreC